VGGATAHTTRFSRVVPWRCVARAIGGASPMVTHAPCAGLESRAYQSVAVAPYRGTPTLFVFGGIHEGAPSESLQLLPLSPALLPGAAAADAPLAAWETPATEGCAMHFFLIFSHFILSVFARLMLRYRVYVVVRFHWGAHWILRLRLHWHSEGPPPRMGHTCAHVAASAEDQPSWLIFVGGSNGSDLLRNGEDCYGDVYVLTIQPAAAGGGGGHGLTWSRPRVCGEVPRQFGGRCHVAAVLEDKLLCFGGGARISNSVRGQWLALLGTAVGVLGVW
jgi:hypothetical protein